MSCSDVAEIEELSESEFTQDDVTEDISTSGDFPVFSGA